MHPYAVPLLVFQYNYGCSITLIQRDQKFWGRFIVVTICLRIMWIRCVFISDILTIYGFIYVVRTDIFSKSESVF